MTRATTDTKTATGTTTTARRSTWPAWVTALVLAACSGSNRGQPAETCHGAPLPCAGRDVTTCNINLGCNETPACTGIATACALIATTNCYSQEGCHWDEADNVCAGPATDCSLAASCSTQKGCSVEQQCGGVPFDCVTLDEVACFNQPGCLWGTGGTSKGAAVRPRRAPA
jgi:hypothetical protein